MAAGNNTTKSTTASKQGNNVKTATTNTAENNAEATSGSIKIIMVDGIGKMDSLHQMKRLAYHLRKQVLVIIMETLWKIQEQIMDMH